MRQNYLRAAAGYRINQPTADGDEHIANTELLLKGEGSNGQTNNTFVDSSASSHTITRNGDTTQGSFSPFSPKGWSMYVDGNSTTHGILGPNVTDTLGDGKGNWTIELWHYLDENTVNNGTAHNGIRLVNNWYFYNNIDGCFEIILNSNRQYACGVQRETGYGPHNANSFNTGIGITGTSTAVLNTWNHVAMVKQGDVLRLYVNGVQEGTVDVTLLTTWGFMTQSRANNIAVGRWFNYGSNSPVNSRYGRGYFSNLRITQNAVYPDGTTFTPDTEPLTAITDCTLLTLQDNRYVDNSSLNSTITAYDDAAIKPTSPFSGNREYPKASYFSGKFDGSNDYLNCGSNSDFAFGTGEFTVEAWVYSNGTQATAAAIFSIGSAGGDTGSWQLDASMGSYPSKWGFGTAYHANYVTSSSNIVHNQWTHLAVSRDSSNVVRLFVNGVLDDSQTISTNLSTTGPFKIGVNRGTNAYFDGYISNARVVKGTCLYTTTFTPPTAPLTPVANTKLLTLQDNYLVDHSPSGHSITNNGGVTLEPESPFDNSTYPLSGTFYSGYFNGTSDNLTISDSADFDFGSGDFTVEGWVKPLSNNDTMYFGQWVGLAWFFGVSNGTLQFSSYSGGNYYVENSGVSASTYYNKWTHIAATREGNALRIFVNGEKKGGDHTISHTFNNSSGNFEIGANSETSPTQYYNGYISNVRIVKGTALYTTDFTVPSEPLTAVSGTKLLTLQDATIQDNSASSHSITNNGATVTEIAPFGTALIDRAGSVYASGSYDYLRANTGYHSDFAFGTGDFTVEGWVYPLSANDNFFDTRTTLTNAGFGFGIGNGTSTKPGVWDGAGINWELQSTGAYVRRNEWTYIAFVRKSQVLKVYINGIESGSATSTRDLTAGGSNIMTSINAVVDPNYTGDTFNGYLSDLRVIKGTALYTSNFTPPTAPLQPITNTKLLLNGNNGGVEDSLGKQNLSTGGDAQIDTTVKKFGSGAIQFDGNGDFLKGTGFDFSGKYTIEGWIYRQTSSGYLTIFCQGGSTHDWATTGVHCLMYIEGVTNKLVLEIPDGSGYRYEIKSASSFPLNVNTWYHFAATCDGTNTSLFIDGQRVGTRQNIIPRVGGSEYEISIGANDGITAATNGSYFVGFMDDFRVTIGVARYDPTQTTHTVPTKTHPTV